MTADTLTRVALDAIVSLPEVQPRFGLDEDTVQRYIDAEGLPPPVVFQVGDDLVLADGWHRVEAARRRGDSDIDCEVRDGTMDDAVEFALLANLDHGLHLTGDERARAAVTLYQLGGRDKQRGPDGGWTMDAVAKRVGYAKGRLVGQLVNAASILQDLGEDNVPLTVATGLISAPTEVRKDLVERFHQGAIRSGAEMHAVARAERAATGGPPLSTRDQNLVANVVARSANGLHSPIAGQEAAAPTLTRAPDGSLVDANGRTVFGRPPTPDEVERGEAALDAMRADAWFEDWVLDAEEFTRDTRAWLDSTTFEDREVEAVNDVLVTARAAAAALQEVIERAGKESR
jgi:hypothetical protein